MALIANYLDGFSGSNVMSLVLNGSLAGVLFHISILKIDFELYMYHFLVAYAVAYLTFLCASIQIGGHAVYSAIFQAFIAFSSFNGGLFTSMVIYRLLLHRCRNYPGPLAAKISRFYVAYLNGKGFEYHKELGNLHNTYGDIVRTGPREISILDKAAIPAIYGPGSECRKASWYGQAGNNPDKVSINMMRDPKKYRMRRRVWDRGFSIKALTSYEPRVQQKTFTLIEKIYAHEGKPMNITDWAMFFSFDVMGEVGFGKDFSNLAQGVEHPAIQCIHEHMELLGVLQAVPWLLNILGSIPGAASSFSGFFDICANETAEKEKVLNIEEEPRDVVSWLLKAIKEKDPSASPTPESLADDTRVLIIAGSDTTANTLANALFYLAKNPESQTKLRGLLDASMPGKGSSYSYEKVRTITYIDDIIYETLRLKPPVIQGGPRETPPQGMRFADTHIPGGVNVSVPYTLMHRDSRWWKQPNDFIPERFGERRIEMQTEDAPYFPFQLGLHSCIGKSLALLSLRTALASIVQNFELSFAPGETGEKFDEQFLDTFLMTLPPLKLVFEPR